MNRSRWQADRTVNSEPIDWQDRLLLCAKRVREDAATARVVAKIAREVGEALPSARKRQGVGSAGDLRGIPVVGVGGTQAGTRPEECEIRWAEAQQTDLPGRLIRRAARYVLEEFDGTSPGTQPELALLAKEAAT